LAIPETIKYFKDFMNGIDESYHNIKTMLNNENIQFDVIINELFLNYVCEQNNNIILRNNVINRNKTPILTINDFKHWN